MEFYQEQSRLLQDKFDTRRIADQLAATRKHVEFNDAHKEIIIKAPMFFLATANGDGRPDCSVKAGNPGFIKILSPYTMTFPDYDGNGMFRSLGNIIANPHVGMLFLELDGERRKLRVNGRASISEDPELLNQMPGARLAIVVTNLDIFPNCPRYVPEIEVRNMSKYSPSRGYDAPEPHWKSKLDLIDFLPRSGLKEKTNK
jgi:predicted pyridoxine 5'-phosphate oxidase superfamily flavin-nucleotide-binding protein